MIELAKTHAHGIDGYKWVDGNDHIWLFYRSISMGGWVYRRTDYRVSSVRFSTLANAVADLQAYFMES